MSTVSASSYDLSSNPMKRKRGRPRKDEVSALDSNRRLLPSPSSDFSLVGQEVSGFFVGVFDAGYLLTVQVGCSGPIMNGLVFDPCLSVPISAENDIAPNIPMTRRNDASPPIEDDFCNQGAVSSPEESHVARDGTLRIFLEGAAPESSSHRQSLLKNEETSTSAVPADVSKPSNGFGPSVVYPLASFEGYRIAPRVVFRSLEASGASQKVSLGETSGKADFEDGEVLGLQTGEVRGLVGENLSSQKSVETSKDGMVNDSLAGCNSISEISVGAKAHNTVAEKLEDGRTVSEASISQP